MRRPLLNLTVRARLAGAFGGLILITGATVISGIYLVLSRNFANKSRLLAVTGDGKPLEIISGKSAGGTLTGKVVDVAGAIDHARHDTLRNLLMISGVMLVVLVLVAALVGWWLSGRALRPLHEITETANRLSETSLHQRIRLQGPRDELRDLADTFDAMLERLDRAFDGQRRFVANASHELRTPLAVQRAALQVGLADPVPADVARVREELLTVNRRSEHLIEGLLLLASSDQRLDDCELVALDALVTEVTDRHRADAAAAGVTLLVDTSPYLVKGDRVLLSHLVGNLVQNGVRYNHDGGIVELSVDQEGLRVHNTGPDVSPDLVSYLLEPFARGPNVRAAHGQGFGLGLSIVRSITRAHGGYLSIEPGRQGGLAVRVQLPKGPAVEGS